MSISRDPVSGTARAAAVIGACMAGAIVTALLMSLALPNVYQSTSEFYASAEAQSFGAVARSGGASTAALPLLGKESEKWMVAVLESAAVRERVARAVPATDAAKLVDGVDADVSRNHILRIRARDRDPAVAAKVANAYPVAFREFLHSVATVRSQSSNVAIQASIEELGRQVREAQTQMEGLLAAEHSPNVREEMQQVVARKAALEADAERLRARQDGIDQRIAVATEQLNKEATRSGALFSDYEQRLMRSVSDVEADLAAARVEFDGKQGERHPRVRALAARLEERQAELARERSRLKQSEVKPSDSFYEQLRREILGLYKDRSAAKAELISSERALVQLNARAAKLPPGLLREQEMAANIARLQVMRDALNQRLNDTRLALATNLSPIIVVAEAVPATSALYPKWLWNLGVAALLGFLAGLGLALWLPREPPRTA